MKQRILISLLVLVFYTSMYVAYRDGTQRECPHLCHCARSKRFASCSNHGKNYFSIPILPSYVQILELNSDHFPWISNSILKPLEHLNLTDLSFDSSSLKYVTKEPFSNLPYLRNLDLNTNVHINVSLLKESFKSLRERSFGKLSLMYMRWSSQHLSMGIFENFEGRTIDTLYLTGNKIEFIPSESFRGLSNLKKMFLSKNNLSICDRSLESLHTLQQLYLDINAIKKCKIDNLPKSLRRLKIDNNQLTELPRFCDNESKAILPKMKYLNLQNNQIRYLYQFKLECFPSLQFLILSDNDFNSVPGNAFSGLRLRELHLASMKKNMQRIGENAFNISSLLKFYFSQNGFRFDSHHFSKATLRACKNLEYLDLSHNHLPKWTEDVRFLLEGLTHLRYLILIEVYWSLIPDHFFTFIPNVIEVQLSENRIRSLNQSLFSKDSRISRLTLDVNRITYVGPNTFPQSLWNSLKSLDLSGNPFVCSCDLLWFRHFLDKTTIRFNQYPSNYHCSSPPEKKGLPLQVFHLREEHCQAPSNLLTILLCSGSVGLFLLIVTLILYKARWQIRYWLYLLRYRRSEYTRISDVSFKYDAFIIYADEDSDFVHDVLLRKLEVEHGFSLCIHFRDFQIGKIIVDNIVECMSECRNVLVILSEGLCQSKWCKFELDVAQDRWLNNETEALFVIMMGEVNCRYMTKYIHALLKTTTYAVWTENEDGNDLFWKKLISAMKIEES